MRSTVIFAISFLLAGSSFLHKLFTLNTTKEQHPTSFTYTSPAVTDLKIREALSFCRKHKLDTTTAFFTDMHVHSGKKRFYIVDLQRKTVLHASLVCHGMGKSSTPELPVFSNIPGSYCTSLGKYRMGKCAFSNWGIGIHYKMYGLEKTNSNAFERIIVLHSYDPVPENEIYPQHLPMGWSQGCPVISNTVMLEADKILKRKKRPVLLWIYN